MEEKPRYRLVVLVSTLGTGGSERQLLQLLTHLDAARFSGAVIVLQKNARHDLKERFEALGRYQVHFATYSWNDPRLLRWIFRTISAAKPDVLLSLSPRGQFFAALFSWVKHFRSHIILERGDRLTSIRLLNLFDAPLILRSAALICCNSRFLARRLHEKGVSEQKIRVIPNLLDPREASGSPTISLRERPALKNKILIGFVGRLDPVKRLPDLLAAAREVEKQLPGKCHFLIVGDGPLRAELEQRVNTMELAPHVTFAGQVENPLSYMREMDIGVLCSEVEGLPNVILEFFVCRVPVVATDVCSIPELIQNEVSGLLVPVGEPQRLAASLIRLAADEALRQKLGSGGFQTLGSRFSPEKVCQEFEDLFREAAKLRA